MVRIDEFNFREIATTDSDYSVIPAGEYKTVIVGENDHETKAGDGKYVRIAFEITDGPCKGRRLWEIYNLWNKSPAAVEMSKKAFAKLIHATGKLDAVDSAELVGCSVVVVTKLENNNMTGQPVSRIKGYKPATSQPGRQPTAAEPDDTPW